MMLRERVNTKIFIILLALAIVVGLALAKLMYPKLPAPVQEKKETQSSSDTVPFIFPEQETFHPVKKAPAQTPPPAEPKKEKEFCAQVITSAVNKQTLEIRQFSTPCDVPEGWEKL